MSEPTKYVLGEDAIPTHWVNLLPELPGEPLPPLNPQTGEPAGPGADDQDVVDMSRHGGQGRGGRPTPDPYRLPRFARPGAELGSGPGTGLGQQVRDVGVDRARRQEQALGDLGELGCAIDEWRQLGRQVMRRHRFSRRRDFERPDAFVERGRLNLGLDAQLVVQDPAARLVLA